MYQHNNKDSTILKKSNKLNISNDHDIERGKIPWPEGTCLIAGDPTILGLQEPRMSKNVKVRGFNGAIIKDMYHYLYPLLEKNPFT